MAILEAFVYDPLISFKLLAQNLMKTNKPEEAKGKKPEVAKMEETKDLGKQKMMHSIVEHVLTRYKDQNDFPESNFSKFRGSADIQPVISDPADEEVIKQEEDILNETAEVVVSRIDSKLKGTDFSDKPLNVEMQVDKLIKQATSHENLAQGYIGWCPFF